jgi:hypothetical protein
LGSARPSKNVDLIDSKEGGEGEEEESGELPVLEGEAADGDAGAVSGDGGELGFHGDGTVINEFDVDEVSPVNDGGDTVTLLEVGLEKFPEFLGVWVLGNRSGVGGCSEL